MLSLDVIDDMLNRLTGRGTVTPTDALRELLEAIDTLESVTFSRDLERYKAEAVWEDAIRRAQDALAAAEKGEPSLDELLAKSRDLARRIALDAEDMVNGELKFDRQQMEDELIEALVVFAHEILHDDALSKHAKE